MIKLKHILNEKKEFKGNLGQYYLLFIKKNPNFIVVLSHS